ncbi:MAG TPA: tyrosine-type recombinase/integrase, partial [Acidimicrobiia bacterium]|nr:tyrosine-type recombinase/integrase [Acidimicrobiia bacterium]
MDHDAAGFAATLTALSPHTRRAYGHDVDEFVAWCERGACVDPAALEHKTLRRYLAYLQTRGFSRPTIARKAAAVRAYTRYLRRRGVLHRNVAVELRSPKGARRLPRVPRAAEAGAVLAGAAAEVDEHRARRDLAVLELLYGAGLRVSECCGLDRGDVDLRRRAVTVLGKGSKIRRVPLGEPAADAVAAYLGGARAAWVAGETTDDALFLNARGRRLGPRDVRRICDRYRLPDG